MLLRDSLRANGPAVPGADHPDINPADISNMASDPEQYKQNVERLYSARTLNEFNNIRRETGINQASIFTGLSRMFPFPLCLTPDIMHVLGSNIPELFVMLWHSGLPQRRAGNDDSTRWEFRVLQGDSWDTLGKEIEAARQYLPNSFESAPRNLATKINSGYKTSEHTIVFWVLFPGMLHERLPDWQYQNFCKLVFAVHVYLAYLISSHETLASACRAGNEFYQEYEERYYQRNPDRLHMCRQSLHNILHLAREITQLGPVSLVAQWPLERLIGELVRQLRQFLDPQTNFSMNGVRLSQENSLFSMFPELDPYTGKLPRGALDLGNGYALLRAQEEKASLVTPSEGHAIISYLSRPEIGMADRYLDENEVKVTWWARLKLKNNQIARSFWKESARADQSKVRQGRNVKVCALAH